MLKKGDEEREFDKVTAIGINLFINIDFSILT